MNQFEIGNGRDEYYVFAEVTSMGIPMVDIRLTTNKNYAKEYGIIGVIHADSHQEAAEQFRVRDLTR